MECTDNRNFAYEVLAITGKLTSEEIEKVIEAILRNDVESSCCEEISYEFKKMIYEVIGDILADKDAEFIINRLNKNQTGWNHSSFDRMKMKQDEQDDFIKNPFEVEEGVLECMCGSKRVYSYQKQTRGSDEPSTTFAECVACKKKWQYSG